MWQLINFKGGLFATIMQASNAFPKLRNAKHSWIGGTTQSIYALEGQREVSVVGGTAQSGRIRIVNKSKLEYENIKDASFFSEKKLQKLLKQFVLSLISHDWCSLIAQSLQTIHPCGFDEEMAS